MWSVLIPVGFIVVCIIILIAHAVSLSNARERDMAAKYAREREEKSRQARIKREREQQIMQRNRIAELERRNKELEKQAERMKRANEAVARREFANEQRRLMTDSLRYDVMHRDNFRCVLCGSSAEDGVTLHVDHIFPVSKGGNTELSNLRTLCDRCNLGKGAKIE